MPGEMDNLIADAEIMADKIREDFGKLSGEQLNWMYSESAWSIGQCFDHLITTNNLYFDKIQKVADKTHTNNWFSVIPFVPAFTGKMMKKFLGPESSKKVKTFPIFEPAKSDISETVIEDFKVNQERLISLLEATKDLNLRKIKIPEPISPVINVNLLDAFEILILHEKRHFNQAKELLAMRGFPR